MAFDGTLKFDTGIDSSGFQSGISSLGDIAKKGLSAIAGMVTAAAGAVTGLGMAAVNVGSGFEKAMAQVAATMGITKDTVQDGVNSYELLQQAAEEAGESTTFSASEAADALNYLALAGYSAEQAAEALPEVLNLAAAGGMELGYASDLATDAMAALGIEASKDNLTHFGDQLAKTASKANASVSQLGEAILVVGGTAKSLSGGTEELNAALGVLANRGIKGAEGGTALRNIILALTAPTDKAAEKLTELGVSVLDSAGNMRGLDAIFQDLDKSLAGMSDGGKTQVLNEIFNKVDLKSAQAMLAGCGDEFRDLTAALSGCDGAMQQMADTMNDTLEGDMKSLQSKAEALGISVYDAISDPLRELAQTGGIYLSKLKSAFDAGGFEWAAKTLGGLLSDAVAKVGRYLPEVFAIGGEVVTALAGGIAQHLPQALRTGEELIKVLAGSVQDSAPVLMQTLLDVLRWLLENFLTADSIAGAARFGMTLIGTLVSSLLDAAPELLGAALGLVMELAGELTSPDGVQMILDAAFRLIGILADALGADLSPLLTAVIQIVEMLGVCLTDHIFDLVGVAQQLLQIMVDAVITNLPVLLNAAVAIVEGLCNAITEDSQSMIEPAVTLIRTLVDYFLSGETVSLLEETAGKLIGAVLRALPQMLGTGLAFGEALVTALVNSLQNADWNEVLQNLIVMLYGVLFSEDLWSGLLGVEFRWDEFFANFEENWKSGFENIKTGLQEIDFSGIFAQFCTDWLSGFSDIWASVKETVGPFFSDIAERAKQGGADFLAGASEHLQELPGKVGEFLGTALGTAARWAVDLGKQAQDAAQAFIANAAVFFVNLPENIHTWLTETLPEIVQWGADLAAKGLQAAGELVDTVETKISELPGKMLEIGKQIILGLIDGINAVKDGIGTAISEFKDGFVSSFKAAFGIQSPSRLMRDEVGKYLALGIGNGFTDYLPDVSEEAKRAFTGLVDGLGLPQLEPIAELDGMEISVDMGAVRELLGLLPQLREVSPGVLTAVREAQVSLSPSSFAPVGQSVVNNYSSYTTNSSTVNSQSSDAPEWVPVRDIIVPVSIGGEEVQTLVINAVRDANAVSGGVTV